MEVIIGIIFVLGVVGFSSVVAAFALARNLIFICEPNEVLIFSGRQHKAVDGKWRGYRIIKGGRAWRIPLIERVDRLDLTNMIIEVEVTNAYSKGGIPLNVQGVANLKIASHEPLLGNAVERLLDHNRDRVSQIAKDVLEGNLRGVLSRLTPEEVNEDKLTFAETLQEEADHDLARLGLTLDTMKIQNVHDDRGYLDSIGRKFSADIIKRSRVAEANAKSLAIRRDAENRERARLQQMDADEKIAVAQAERRIVDAQTMAAAMMAEETGQVNAKIAKAESAMEAEEARVDQVRLQLEADVIEPAKAAMEAGIAEAKGQASQILEQGRATVSVLEEMIQVWKSAGPNARDIFLMQKLDVVMQSLVSTIGEVQIDRITMLPNTGAGSNISATNVVRLVEELKASIGVDLPKLLQDATSKGE
jgi:flotillin